MQRLSFPKTISDNIDGEGHLRNTSVRALMKYGNPAALHDG
jgi:hypothetical protein